MGKKKLTLNVDEELLREVKSALASEGKSISGVVEELLGSVLAYRWVEELAESLGLGRLDPLDPSEIPRSRRAGLDAAKIVRELRNERAGGA